MAFSVDRTTYLNNMLTYEKMHIQWMAVLNVKHFMQLPTKTSAYLNKLRSKTKIQPSQIINSIELFNRIILTQWHNSIYLSTICLSTYYLPMYLSTCLSIYLASLLFDPLERQLFEEHSVSRFSYLFAHLHLLSSDLVFSDLLSSNLSLLSAFALLCSSSLHIIGSLTSKLPSYNIILYLFLYVVKE